MKSLLVKSELVNRLSLAVLAAFAAVRLYQFATADGQSFESGNADLGECFAIATHISLAVFVLVPLFIVYMVPSLRVFSQITCCTRFPNRERLVVHFLSSAFLKSLLFAFAVNCTAVLVLYAKCPVSFDFSDVAIVAMTSLVLETLFFLACSLLMLAAYLLTSAIGLAAIAVFCYAIWDFVVANTPFVPSQVVIGWHLTQIVYPAPLPVLFVNLAFLAALSVAFACVCFLLVRNRDFIEVEEGQ